MKWVRRAALSLGAFIVLIAFAGVGYEMISRYRAARDFPLLGKLVDIGGRRIQLDCRGTGTPAVVFEAGLGTEGALSWSMVHDAVAGITRACAYSRAGIMWSDPRDGPQNGKTIAEDLHATLLKSGEKPPFVLVGHSLGGPYIMIYTKYFGSDVAGLVFVDASHPDQQQRFMEAGLASKPNLPRRWLADLGAVTGVVRAGGLASMPISHMPENAARAVAAYAPSSLDVLKEMGSIQETLAEAGTFRQLGDRPIFVLTAMAPIPNKAMTSEQKRKHHDIWLRLQDDEVSWSSKSQHRLVPDAGHFIQFDRPDYVIEAVRSVVESVRAKQMAKGNL